MPFYKGHLASGNFPLWCLSSNDFQGSQKQNGQRFAAIKGKWNVFSMDEAKFLCKRKRTSIFSFGTTKRQKQRQRERKRKRGSQRSLHCSAIRHSAKVELFFIFSSFFLFAFLEQRQGEKKRKDVFRREGNDETSGNAELSCTRYRR